ARRSCLDDAPLGAIRAVWAVHDGGLVATLIERRNDRIDATLIYRCEKNLAAGESHAIAMNLASAQDAFHWPTGRERFVHRGSRHARATARHKHGQQPAPNHGRG